MIIENGVMSSTVKLVFLYFFGLSSCVSSEYVFTTIIRDRSNPSLDSMWILLAYTVGLALAWPQLRETWAYLPKSIRAHQTWQDKSAIGNISPWRFLKGLLTTRLHDQPDGVFYPEACCYVGLLGLMFACYSSSAHQWLLLVTAIVLACGRLTPCFRWCAPFMLRIPARMVYFANLALVFMAVSGLSRFQFDNRLTMVIVILQSWDLLMNTSRLWPMLYTQRWERPSKSFNTPLMAYLKAQPGDFRVSGMPFPNTTGQLHQIKSLGYNGGAGLAAMARFRGTAGNPYGVGGHDWFSTREDGPDLNWWGVRYAYTYRSLSGKWFPTPIPHLYENLQVAHIVPRVEALDDR